MTYYRKDLVEKAGMTMPDQPTYPQIKEMAAKIHDPANQVYGICLRGKPGWGENMALISTMVNTFGGQWFDQNWNAKIDSPEWKEAVSFYIDLLKNYGPPGASSNGFNENLAMFSNGQCGMWIDGWVSAPPGTRQTTYENKQYLDAAPFAGFVEKAIETADPVNTTKNPKPYIGVQFVGIPEFQAVGTQTGQTMAAALTGQMKLEQALKAAQSAAERAIKQAGYLKK
jgi:ABC-type glycerol-3-phosphate transport system substrate-binding protein